MSKQHKNSILNYFSPSGATGTNSPSTSTTPGAKASTSSSSTSGTKSSHHGGSSTKKTDLIFSTPLSSRTKRRTSAGSSSLRGDESNKRKKTDETSPKDERKEFVKGGLVWARLEGYPFWPGLLTCPPGSDSFFRQNGYEYHVQFLDDPPSRAWIRKADLKVYTGLKGAEVTVAKGDASWVESCKLADSILNLSPQRRLEKHKHEFERVPEDDGAEESDVQELKTPEKRRGSPVKRKRINVIESSEEDEPAEELDKKITPKVVKKSNGEAVKVGNGDKDYQPNSEKVIESESSDSDDWAILSESEDKVPKKSKAQNKDKGKGKTAVQKLTPSRQNDFKSKLAKHSFGASPGTPSTPSTPSTSTASSSSHTNFATSDDIARFPHLKLPWLLPDKVRDKNKRSLDDPDYDGRTLFVPSSYLDSLTPAVRQWWKMKEDHFDTVLFFKVGKFYELYHMDAVIGVQELGLTFMKGDFAHCGFPESAYSRFAPTLVQKGYKVARIEQTETPEMMTERCKKQVKPTKFDKVVKREICQITTKGIRVASVQDPRTIPFQPDAEYLFAITEKSQLNGQTEYGVCFVDTTIGVFNIGQFIDDRHCSRLRTLFSHHKPVQILYERNKISAVVQQILESLASVRKDALASDSQFWGFTKTLKFLAEGQYFLKDGGIVWPEYLKAMLSKDDSLCLTPDEDWKWGISALGAVIWYLKECLAEYDVLSLKEFQKYIPLDLMSSTQGEGPEELRKLKNMVLDGATLRNLEITHGPKSLLSIVDKCSTQFGKRLLRHWVCAPLASPKNIAERQDAVQELMGLQGLTSGVTPLLRSLQDLERLLIKIHSLGSLHRSKDHPDARAIMFEDKIYSKRKIIDLTNVLRNFKTCVKIIGKLKEQQGEIQSKVLANVISGFPSLDSLLEFFDNAFDHEKALAEGKIQPREGVDEDLDHASEAIVSLVDQADAYLKEVRATFRNSKICYVGTEKKRYQLEIPESVNVPSDFVMSSHRKGFKRYVTSKSKEILAKVLQAEVTRENILKDITRRVFAQFDSHRELWNQAVGCISNLDALISLSAYSKSQEVMCRPVLVNSSSPFMKVVDGRHPCIASDSYIPNTTDLGNGPNPQTFVLLTGANMGGKSTLMRQVGLISVLAHMGCYVPAVSCEMSVVDRIFTRLGANDNIIGGESTFFVELSETSVILKHASKNSLLLMDELGRGTATYDGTAIAFAVAEELAFRGCRTIFSTHYHNLVESVEKWPSAQLGHMACMVDNENEDDPTQETITFLYKYALGACPRSYGFNAARLAGIPDDTIRVAHGKAKELENYVSELTLFKKQSKDIRKNRLTKENVKQALQTR